MVHQIVCICKRDETIENKEKCPTVHFLASPPPESHLSSSLHPPIPFPSPALCTSLFPFQHSITAAWSPGDVSLLRSDVVGYANRPSRPLLLTRPGPHFSRPTETHTQTHKKYRKKTHIHETHAQAFNTPMEISRHCMFSYVRINVATTTFDLTLIWSLN